MTPSSADTTPLGPRPIARLWWPLAASWMLMGLEFPLVAAALSRLPDAEVNLAAHGGIVIPVALVIESPIMMLLAASTALGRDASSYRLIRRFMMTAGAALTIVHAAVAFTPAYDIVAVRVLGAPLEIRELARLGLALMLPWTWSIAYRRFHQGLLIRHGLSRPVVLGTLVRLATIVGVLSAGLWHGGITGIALGSVAVSAAVLAEAAFIGACARGVVRGLATAPEASPPLGVSRFLHFYVPLAVTQVLSLAIPALTAAAMSRMPQAIASLAAWPAASGLSFMLRGSAFAFHEVAVSLLDRPGARRALRRFARGIAAVTAAAALALGATPLGDAWFGALLGLPEHVARLAQLATLAGAALPAISALESWWQGRLVHAHRTRSVTAGTAIYLAGSALLLSAAVAWSPGPGIVVATLAVTLASAAKASWLAARAGAVAA